MIESLKPPLQRIHWDVTNQCNFNCYFCFNNSGKAHKDELTQANVNLLLNECRNFGVRFLILLGGEIFTRKDIFDIFEIAADNKMLITFSTNGSLIEKEASSMLHSIKEWLHYVQVSLYGSSSKEYEYACGNKAFFKSACKGIESLVNVGIHPTIFSPITDQNRANLTNLYKTACSLGAKSFRVTPAQPIGRAKDCKDIITDRIEFYKSLQDLASTCDMSCPIEVTEYPAMAAYIESKLPIKAMHHRCSAGEATMYISPTGKAQPCPFHSSDLEDTPPKLSFPHNSIKEIWYSTIFKDFRKDATRTRSMPGHNECKENCKPCPLGKQPCKKIIQELDQKVFGGNLHV